MLKTLGAGAVATGLAGCVGGDGGDGGGLETTGVVIPQFGLWDTTGPWLVGRDQGFFEEEGLDVERIDAEGGGGNVRTVVAGDAQIGMATGIAGLMAAYREDTNVTIVSNEINQSSDLFWYGLAGETEAEGVEAVVGLSLGFSSPGSSTNMVSLTAAERYGGEAVSIGGPPDANAAVEGGEVDLAWSAGQFFSDGVQSGDYDFLRSVIEESYPQEAMDLTAFQGIEDANQVAVDFDFIDEKLSQEELNELIDTTPVTGSDEF
jgi:NitT/TauT family transport system substrate-binding protein